MAKYFLGSVGKAEAFKVTTDSTGAKKLELAFVSKTLTDSGLNISTTKDDIRAGEGAPIQFSFYHDANVEITLTDVLWKPEYLEAQLGAQFSTSNAVDYITKTLSFTNGSCDYTTYATSAPIQKIQIPCLNESAYLVWAAPKGTDNWVTATYNDTAKTITLADTTATGDYCVRFLSTSTEAQVAEITSTIIPEELFLIITAPIFAGDACAASKGKAAGHITFEVPRFQLNGAQEFAMNMSQNQTMSLSGIAAASESEDCDANGGKLLRIIEVITDRSFTQSIQTLMSDEETEVAGKAPAIYGILNNGELIKVPAGDLEFAATEFAASQNALTASYVYAPGTYYFRLKDKPAVKTQKIVIA